ncbi:hypothetical protein [Elizabethkingia anophelis]|uniref:hypothetical protein n=1 Tax=Elizabethkingia anophelis TaxID=1117645 RepID=UPI000442B660|nr:hypothetical protein [Elizabethkingia anophelis]MCT3846085.1 hypothetical protein [Elizabethkingia anophelis]MDV3597873.1 hypothetical protein [Elizabethkingia anophelis]MVW83789.1 hypothetical protein [Elizabethkingia anophelis]CDN74512.1 hypothetical protein E18064_30009 [Elizabethkingia anophelis]CDN76742.1 hypothetical protein E27107_110009 [Elizabethkingia anophelis]
MKLIILPKGLSEDLLNYDLSQIESKEFDDLIDELKQIDNEVNISTINLGKGADWVLILIILGSIGGVISYGDKLEKGIEGWTKIGKRLINLFKKSDRVYVDEDGAKILAITYISEKYNIKSITLLDNHTTFLADFSSWFNQRDPKDFTSKPFNIYNLTFDINNERTISLCIKSNGEIIELLNTDKEFIDHSF